mmetsp:Transcript_44481/g.96775  ORF Transcript_44481/g.96775 Transcript_44481/m.96775 type:complete len:342 (-) Transcript_44481:107-1132(-)
MESFEPLAPGVADGAVVATSGQRPSPLQAGSTVLIPLCRKGDRAAIEKCLQAGAYVNETDVEGNTPLHVAVEAPRNEIATLQCLLEMGAEINLVNYLGAAPLHYVCLRRQNQRGVANILLENGADIHSQTLAGKTPLHFACEHQSLELVEVFCLFGADTNLQDSDGCSPLHSALAGEGRDTVKRQIMEILTTYHAMHVLPNNQGMMPLHLACRSGHMRCVQFLLDRQADGLALTSSWQTCLHLACAGGHHEVAQLLVTLFPGCLNATDSEGNTPLHVCALSSALECALVLLKAGANPQLRNAQKKSVVDLAELRGTDLSNTHNPELVQALREASKGGCMQS